MSSSEWRTKELGEITKIKGRIGWKGYKTTDLRDYGPVVLGGNNIKNSIYLDLSYIKCLSREKFEESPEIMLEKNDVLVVTRGNGIGDVSFFNGSIKEATINPSMVILSQCTEDPKFLFYYLISPLGRNNVLSVSSGSSIPAIYQKSLKTIRCPLPPIDEQKAIAATLSCLDDKIELNNRMNKNLEEMAQAIFKSWFVDFEPFQDGEFEESELGMIPKGWRVVNVDSVTVHSCTGGDAIQKTPMVDYNTGIKCVRVGDLSNQRDIDGWGYCKVDDDNFKKYQLKKNDIIVTRTATLGLNQIVEEDLMAVFNNGLIRLRLSDEIIPTFFYFIINTDNYREYIGRIESESSTRPNMKMNYLLKYQFICPPKDIQQEFLQVVEVIRNQRLWLQKQNVTLVTTRNSLLPKLMSGEIRVPIEEV